jgi:hypothetical protein
VRGGWLRDQAVDLQPLAVLLAARAGSQLCSAGETEVTQRGGIGGSFAPGARPRPSVKTPGAGADKQSEAAPPDGRQRVCQPILNRLPRCGRPSALSASVWCSSMKSPRGVRSARAPSTRSECVPTPGLATREPRRPKSRRPREQPRPARELRSLEPPRGGPDPRTAGPRAPRCCSRNPAPCTTSRCQLARARPRSRWRALW